MIHTTRTPAQTDPQGAPNRSAISVVELLTTLGVVSIALAIAAPAILKSRERARSTQCKNNLRQCGLAAATHESVTGVLPYTSTRWTDVSAAPIKSRPAISAHRELMPYLDPSIFAQIDLADPADPAWSAQPPSWFIAQSNQAIQLQRVPVLSCPSDTVPAGATSYRTNLGVSVEILPPSATVELASQRGGFVNGRSVRAAEFADGLSNTALFAERVIGDYSTKQYEPFRDIFATFTPIQGTDKYAEFCRENAVENPVSEFSFGGASWLLGGWLNTWYSHVLPPNSGVPDCGDGPEFVDGGRVVVTARSLHPGGAHVAMGDGSVRFVANNIDLAVWRSAGTRNGRVHPAID